MKTDIEKIVSKWNISWEPEYREFRCAICQKPVEKAWHFFLENDEYKTPVHICDMCYKKEGYAHE